MSKSFRIGFFFPVKLHNNPLVSCSLRNFHFLLLRTKHFDKNIILPFLVFKIFGFLFPVFSLHFKQQNNIALYIAETFIYH